MDKVFIEGLQIEALIGIYDWERRIRQPLEFDLEMAFDNRRPAATDAIADTLDYKAVSKRLIEYVGQSDFGLVETLAERVAAIVLDEFDVAHVRLKLSKPGAVRGARAVGVIIERSRQTARREGEKVASWPATPAVVPVADTDDVAAPPAPSEVAHGATAHAAPQATADETDAAPAGATSDATPAPATSPAIDTTPADAADPRLQAALSVAMSGWHSTARTDVATWAPEPATTVEDAGASPGTIDDAARPDGEAAAVVPAPEGEPLAVDVENVLAQDANGASTKLEASTAGITTAAEADSETNAAEGDAADAAPAVEADATKAAPSEPAAPPAQRANFMRDLDEAPVRPGIAVAEALAVAGAAQEELPARNEVPAAATEPPPMPGPATEPAAVAEPAHFPTPPAAAAAPAAAASVGAVSNASLAAAIPAATASPVATRRAPPPPPRPRNPASDLGRETRPAYLSLGSNIEPEQNLRSALMALRARFGEVIVSPVYRMPAVGFDGPDFLNAAVIIDSDLDPFALTRWLRGIESAHGRMRTHVKNSSRTLDMDIIFFDDLVLDLPGGLQLPRPELRHAFVLKPLVDIAPGFVDPVRGTHLADVWASHPEHDQRFATVSI